MASMPMSSDRFASIALFLTMLAADLSVPLVRAPPGSTDRGVPPLMPARALRKGA